MYAIIETGGKQYKVREGDTVDVELLGVEAGETIELDRVLMVAGGDQATVGKPTVEGALVRATVVDEVKGEKVVVFKYKPKNRYRRKTGHRQKYTRLQIEEIIVPEPEKYVEEVAAPSEEVPAAEAVESTEAPVESAPEISEEARDEAE
ncbi:MAG: 50S ribosomal protein L21 [Chloroflexi bacterium]|nr:MAG: 50S ribosomal protein L21 [Chloroflexota bacterium]